MVVSPALPALALVCWGVCVALVWGLLYAYGERDASRSNDLAS